MYDKALSFNKNNYLLVNNAPELNPSNQITIAAWIKPTTSGTQYVVKKGRQDSTDGFELSLSSDGKVFVRFNQASSGDSFRVNSTSKYPTNGSTWLHVAATYDGSTIKLYINGVPQASKNASFQISSNSLPLAIGAQDDGYRGLRGLNRQCEAFQSCPERPRNCSLNGLTVELLSDSHQTRRCEASRENLPLCFPL